MSQEEQPENQKTVVAFVAGLLIGGLLVWVFSSPEAAAPSDTGHNDDRDQAAEQEETVDEMEETADEAPETTMTVGDGSISVANQPAGLSVTIDSATFPTSEGWVAVRSYPNGQLGSILGAIRYSEAHNLVPESVPLLAPTTAGRTYAVVFFTEDGDRQFNLANDVQVDGVLSTFTAE